MGWWFGIALWKRVVGALFAGIALGLIWGPDAETIKWIGDLFVKAIKMLVVPLIFFSLVSGVAALGDLRKLGRVGGRAMILFLITAQIAVWLGMGMGMLFQPGSGLDIANLQRGTIPEVQDNSFSAMILSMVPDSPVRAMADVEVLPLIIFSLLVGAGILMARDEAKPVTAVFDAGATVMTKVTMIVMELTPFGVFALMAWVAGTLGVEALTALGQLVVLNYVGCFIIIGIVYSLMIRFVARQSVVGFYRGALDAMVVAFSTASSNAALPVTLRCAQRNLGVSKSVSSFVISLGATINMNGTAMFLGLVTMFGAQFYGVTLDFTDMIMIAITGTLAAIGAAGIPGSGLIMMTLVLTTVGVPLETIALVAGVNHVMDMMRTCTNVTGDAAVAVTVAAMTGDLDVEELESADDI
jgi:Na+/H+-dicarboxylate symporter